MSARFVDTAAEAEQERQKYADRYGDAGELPVLQDPEAGKRKKARDGARPGREADDPETAAVRKAAQQAKARGDRKTAIKLWNDHRAGQKSGNGSLHSRLVDQPPGPPAPRPARQGSVRRQKTAGRAGDRRFRERNRPPEGEPWVWDTYEMLTSPSWIVMPLTARQVVEAIKVEHMKQAGLKNGELRVTYDNIAARGVRRQSIPEAIEIAQALGWIEVTFAGGASYGSGRRPSEYALTWLPKCNGAPATYRWVQINAEQAKAIVACIRKGRRG